MTYCHCRACIPNTAPAVCSVCGEEIRSGIRDGQQGWWHRLNVDHVPVHGHRVRQLPPAPEEEAAAEPLPAPEVPSHTVGIDSFPPRSGIRQICNLVEKTDGWEIRRLTLARGPYVGAKGEMLSISDVVVLGARGPELDGGHKVAVASWRDGKFDFAYIGVIKDGRLGPERVTTAAMKDWIKT